MFSLLLLLALPALAQAQFTYTIDNGTVTITGCTSAPDVVTIPDTINGLPVTSIGDYAFQNCYYVFYFSIPNSVTNIGGFAFYWCTSLMGLYFQGNAPSLRNNVFEDSNATVYYLPGTTGWGTTFGGRPTALMDSANHSGVSPKPDG